MILQFSGEERDTLISLLDSAISESRAEIYRTEEHNFKESIRSKKFIMEELLQRFTLCEEVHEPRNLDIKP